MKLAAVKLVQSVNIDGENTNTVADSRVKSLEFDAGLVRVETKKGRKLLIPVANVVSMEAVEEKAPKAKDAK